MFCKFWYVEIYIKKSFMLDEDINCELIDGKQPGTRIVDARIRLKYFVAILIEQERNIIDKIILESVSSDALTLLALIPKVSPIKRQILFQKISNFFSPPKDVTRMGIVTPNYDMLDSWWNEIEWQI
jgi:hypothetical protein